MNRRASLSLLVSVFGGGVLVACSSASSPSSATPISAQSTQAVATAQAVAPTVQAVATQVVAPTLQAAAPTLQSAATQVTGTVTAASPVRINSVQTSNSDASVVVQNTSPSAVDLTGWQLRVGSASAALPAGMSVAPGDTVTLHTASGTSTPSNIYIGPAAQNLTANLQPGAQVVLQSPSGPVTAFTVPGR
jgi:lamin tail-like protein